MRFVLSAWTIRKVHTIRSYNRRIEHSLFKLEQSVPIQAIKDIFQITRAMNKIQHIHTLGSISVNDEVPTFSIVLKVE